MLGLPLFRDRGAFFCCATQWVVPTHAPRSWCTQPSTQLLDDLTSLLSSFLLSLLSPSPRPSLSLLQPMIGSFSVTMVYESVKFYGWLGLALAASRGPVVASVAADSDSFRGYAGVRGGEGGGTVLRRGEG